MRLSYASIYDILRGVISEVNKMRESKEMQVGKAGEYVACADLIMKGLIAFPSEQGLPYDVLIDTGDRILRLQVKATGGPRVIPQRKKESHAYIFNIKRCGKGNKSRYSEKEIDVFALVALDSMQVGYVLASEMPENLSIRIDALEGSYYDEKGIQNHDFVKKLSASGLSMKEISEQSGVHYSAVSRMLKNGYKPFKSSARYMSELQKTKEWFCNV